MYQVIGDNDTEPDGIGFYLWDRIIGLLEQELDWRRSRKLFVTLQGESGSYQKEIGELLPSERRSLASALREHVAEQLLERRHAYTKLGHRMHREQAMDLLWPELGKKAAFNNMHQTFHAARRALTSDPAEGWCCKLRAKGGYHSGDRCNRLWSVLPAHDVLAGRMGVFEGTTLQHSVYRLRRIPVSTYSGE